MPWTFHSHLTLALTISSRIENMAALSRLKEKDGNCPRTDNRLQQDKRGEYNGACEFTVTEIEREKIYRERGESKKRERGESKKREQEERARRESKKREKEERARRESKKREKEERARREREERARRESKKREQEERARRERKKREKEEKKSPILCL
ncbi:hypothetical protein Bpfe_004861 [Biomphalaria pfeifferi]|uniref:Uncharacterized protein n=1 Tax=Biomphalaria pfeifferi TaxID=112525 RepID=A0AAD8C351_BIOPF|nr:hypothetical protein Bpfe_004861 [Biomphalaria pfeifferi]